MSDHPPEHKIGSIIAQHRGAIKALSFEAQRLVERIIVAAETNDDATLHDNVCKLDMAQGSIRSRLLQIRAAKDVAKAVGITAGILKAQTT